MLGSLKSRLALWILLPTILLASIDLSIIYRDSENVATSVQQRILYGSAKIIAEQLSFNNGSYDISIPPAAFELFKSKHADHVYYSVRTKEGRLIAGGDELSAYEKPIEIEEEKYYLSTINDEVVRVIAIAQALPNSSSGDYAITQVAQTLHGHNEFRDGLITSTVRGHLLMLLITAISLFVAVRWTFSPLMTFSAMLSQRKPGSLEKLEYHAAPTELRPVISALNGYAEKLGQTLTAYEKFVSNTAHHLRTSFAIMTSQIDYGKRSAGNPQILTETLDSIRKTMIESTKLISQLLVLAAMEQNRQEQENIIPIRLSESITSVIEEMAPLAQQRRIELGVDDFDENVFVTARPHLLHEIFSNLIDNAIQHMGKPGSVIISIVRESGYAHIKLVDDGVGVPENLQSKLFDRFFRIDTSRANSSGLGLAIVKEICEALGGSVTACTPDSGQGLQFDIYLPFSQD